MGERSIQLKDLDEAIRAGRATWVKSQLSTIRVRSLTRADLLPLAGIARRVGRPSIALKLLGPLIYPKKALQSPATQEELASYALSLAAIGAVEEAFSLVKDLQQTTIPEVQLCRAFLNIHTWNYQAAARELERYLLFEKTTDYQKSIADLNLCNCLLFLDRSQEALERAERLARQSQEHGWRILHREALLRIAQSYLQLSEWNSARLNLERAETVESESSLETFYIRKWKWILQLQTVGMTDSVRTSGESLRSEASRKRLWEGVRDIEYHQALMTRDTSLVERVYFGSPFPSYRERIRNVTGSWMRFPEEYELKTDPTASQAIPELNLSEGESRLTTQFLRCLSSDFYRPLTVGTLFTSVYRGEIYNPVSSPGRVRTGLVRARQWLSENGFPLRIECVGQDYRLVADAPCIVRLRLDYERSELFPGARDLVRQLKSAMSGVRFSTEQAAVVVGLSPRKTRALLLSLAESEGLHRSGSGRGTRFHFAAK